MSDDAIFQDLRDSDLMFVHSSLDDAGLTAQQFRIYAHLARRAGRDGAYPGIDSMAKHCLLSKHTVIDAVRVLESRGMVKVSRSTGERSRYILTRKTEWKITVTLNARPVQMEERCGANAVTPPVQTEERKVIQLRESIEGGAPLAPEPVGALPGALNTDAFRTAWGDYLKHRRTSKMKKLQAQSVRAKWDEMAAWGEPVAIEAIRQSIANGYQGIFAPKGTNGANRTRKPDDQRYQNGF